MSATGFLARVVEARMVRQRNIEAAESGRVDCGTCITQGCVVGPANPRKKQPRNQPCGCGSGMKAKKCCGEYPQVAG